MLNHCFHTYREKKDGAIILSKLRDLVTTRDYQKKISEENIRRKYQQASFAHLREKNLGEPDMPSLLLKTWLMDLLLGCFETLEPFLGECVRLMIKAISKPSMKPKKITNLKGKSSLKTLMERLMNSILRTSVLWIWWDLPKQVLNFTKNTSLIF